MGLVSDNQALQQFWSDPEIVRARTEPRFGDWEYLVLSDLKLFLERFATKAPIRVLDFGAGPSPYRSLFPNAEYKRADLTPAPGIDYVVGADSSLAKEVGSFDLVLSTQVAEHLAEPVNYFREALRVLKPGGQFVVTTHGTWEEHGAPFDFQRWTVTGLDRDLRAAGWEGSEFSKLTAGDRASLFLLLRWLRGIHTKQSFLGKIALGLLRRLSILLQPTIHRCSDRWMKGQRIVGPPHEHSAAFYIILAAVCRKGG